MNRLALSLAFALAACLLVASCSTLPSSTPPRPSSTQPSRPVLEQNAGYETLEALRDAAVESGYECPSWTRLGDDILINMAGSRVATCRPATGTSDPRSPDDLFILFGTTAQRDFMFARDQKPGNSIPNTVLYGPNWMIQGRSEGADLRPLQATLGGTMPNRSTGSPDSSSGPNTAASSTTSQVANRLQGVAHVKTADGYTYDLEYDVRILRTVVDVKNDRPGYNTVLILHDSSLTATNTTPGRKLPLHIAPGSYQPSGFFLYATYSAKDLGVWVPAGVDTVYLPLVSVFASDGTLQPSQSLTSSALVPEPGQGDYIPRGTGVGEIPDSSVASAQRALLNPTGLVVLGQDVALRAGVCDKDLQLKGRAAFMGTQVIWSTNNRCSAEGVIAFPSAAG